MRRLVRLSDIDIKKLESDYQKMILDNEKEFFHSDSPQGERKFELMEPEGKDDTKTLLLNPMLVEYENDQLDTAPHPGIQGLWSASLRWLGR